MLNCFFLDFNHNIRRLKTTQVSLKDNKTWLEAEKTYGQPTAQTHPHILKPGRTS